MPESAIKFGGYEVSDSLYDTFEEGKADAY